VVVDEFGIDPNAVLKMPFKHLRVWHEYALVRARNRELSQRPQ
jgi:hypothetical protein